MMRRLLPPLLLLLGLGLVVDRVLYLLAESFWFQAVGYLNTLLVRVQVQVIAGVGVLFLSGCFLLSNLALAQRWRYPQPDSSSPPVPPRFPLRLRGLLMASLGLALIASGIFLYSSWVTFSALQPVLNAGQVLPPLPEGWNFQAWRGAIAQLPLQQTPLIVVGLVGLISLVTALILAPGEWLLGMAIGLSLSFGLMAARQWTRLLLFFHPTPFTQAEPQFGRDISFYVFNLPVLELLKFWLMGVFVYSIAAVALVYLLSGGSLNQGKFPGFTNTQLRHLSALGTCALLAVALQHWVYRYKLLYSTRGVVYGAGYTSTWVELPAHTGLSFLAMGLAILLLGFALRGPHPRRSSPIPFTRHRRFAWRRLLGYGVILYLVTILVATNILPTAVQQFVVQPNELQRERPFILRNIALTRQGFGLATINAEVFNPEDQLTYTNLLENDLTVRNIRLWDTRPLLQTNRQLQQIRPYYRFPGADIDRYTLSREEPNRPLGSQAEPIPPILEKQQVLIAARELDYSAVPQAAQTWVNQHLIYTHGYGFTLSPVNAVATGGLPYYFVKDIGLEGTAQGDGGIGTSSDRIRATIPIGFPRIYYGELTTNYVMTNTRVQEFDYPSGSENVYNVYDGRGGIGIGNWAKRLLFARHLRDWQMLLTQNFTPDTRLLFRRDIKRRIEAIAPFLRYDGDPYLVTANVREPAPGNRGATRWTDSPSPSGENYLYWIVDAYTTSDRYPYSDPGGASFNYIRNSVKVVVDAYHGSVEFYVADPDDPVVTSWGKIFPTMFKPLDEMPPALRSHIRYPVDLFTIQSQRLLAYHMTDPQVFYNREDLWQIPSEIYGGESRQVEPYYLIMDLPTDATNEEFILLRPFTPTGRANLVGWLAARSDGYNYGKLLLYQFPKQELVYGPEQIEARINQDPVISQQITLWNRAGSRVIQGNLLVIPIENSLLYVEPIYLEAEQNSLPTLVRVVVAYENRIVMAETLDQAIRSIFQAATTTEPIVRPVEP